MFEVYQCFAWYIIARPDDNGKMWYVSHIRRNGDLDYMRDSLYARHFTRNTAAKLAAKFNELVEV